MALSGDREVSERKAVWFDASVARCLKYFSLFGPELTAEGL